MFLFNHIKKQINHVFIAGLQGRVSSPRVSFCLFEGSLPRGMCLLAGYGKYVENCPHKSSTLFKLSFSFLSNYKNNNHIVKALLNFGIKGSNSILSKI